MNIGVLGGTFDPIHIGHIKVAAEVVARLDLPRILFMPAGQPWLKLNNANAVSPLPHRLEMVRLGISGNPRFKLSTMEVERTGPTYTVDTIAQLQAQRQANPTVDLAFYALRDMDSCDWPPFVKAAVGRYTQYLFRVPREVQGISFMSDNVAWHHKVPNEDQYRQAMAELEEAVQ